MNCGNEIKMKKWSSLKSFSFFSGFFTQLHKLRSLRRSFLHFHFISAVHIWFTSYIINTHFFHGNIWTHNWPSSNVSGFIAQLVEHRTGVARSRVQTPLKSWIFCQASLRNCINCVHCDDHFFIFISFPQFIYDLFHISLTGIIVLVKSNYLVRKCRNKTTSSKTLILFAAKNQALFATIGL